MRERSVAEVLASVAAQRHELDNAISRQSFYCTKLKLLVSPAECHDCFASLPYTERLMRWNENRMLCIEAHSSCSPSETLVSKQPRRSGSLTVTPSRYSRSRAHRERVVDKAKEGPYSLEEYLSRGLLEFLLELDSLTERFENWQVNLTGSARQRIHQSLELQEMILWFAESVADFHSALLRIGRNDEEEIEENERRNDVG